MKLLVLLFALTSTAHAAPLDWNSLAEGDALVLTQKIQLGNPEPFFPAGTSLRLESREPLAMPGALLMLYRLTQSPCPHPEWESGMEIVTPAGNPESSAVGVQLGKGCQWEIFLEQKDLSTSSFFAR